MIRASDRQEALIWLAQRISAALLAVFVLVHLLTMIVVIDQGLSAAEILARTRGNATWAVFYGLFVLAAAVHGGAGLRGVAYESGASRLFADLIGGLFALVAVVLGARAVWAVFSS